MKYKKFISWLIFILQLYFVAFLVFVLLLWLVLWGQDAGFIATSTYLADSPECAFRVVLR
jgi:hypothetical protein